MLLDEPQTESTPSIRPGLKQAYLDHITVHEDNGECVREILIPVSYIQNDYPIKDIIFVIRSEKQITFRFECYTQLDLTKYTAPIELYTDKVKVLDVMIQDALLGSSHLKNKQKEKLAVKIEKYISKCHKKNNERNKRTKTARVGE